METPKKHYIIYKITNLINGKIYIGQHQTFNLDDGYMGSSAILNSAIKKYGIENFKKEILKECNTFDEMNFTEAEIVDKDFIARSDTYNVSVGGTFGWENCNKALRNNEEKEVLRKKHAAEQIRKHVKEHPEFRNNVSNGLKRYYSEHESAWVGKKHKEETKAKIGKANAIHQRGNGNSHYGTHWWINPTTGESHPIKEGDPIPDGWIRGRKCKISEIGRSKLSESGKRLNHATTIGYKWITNGNSRKLLKPNEQLPEGWRFCRHL